MLSELSSDYVSYVKVDIARELSPIVDNVEDMLTRLEEFESLITMVQVNGSQCLKTIVPDVVVCLEDLQHLCERVDSLELFIQQVKHDLDIVEGQMDMAETQIGSTEGKIKKLFKPLFFKRNDAVARSAKSPSYKPPDIFNTSDFFSPEKEGDPK